MKHVLSKGALILGIALALISCSSSKKSTSSNGRIIVIDGKHVRVEGASRKDNGLHKGWSKNPNNPHHPNTTNPGHTKQKGKPSQVQKKGKKKK